MRLEDLDIARYFPRPVGVLLSVFKDESQLAIKTIISKLGLVTKEEYLVQKKLLEDAYEQVAELTKAQGD